MVDMGTIPEKEKDLELFSVPTKSVTWMDEAFSAKSLEGQRLRDTSWDGHIYRYGVPISPLEEEAAPHTTQEHREERAPGSLLDETSEKTPSASLYAPWPPQQDKGEVRGRKVWGRDINPSALLKPCTSDKD